MLVQVVARPVLDDYAGPTVHARRVSRVGADFDAHCKLVEMLMEDGDKSIRTDNRGLLSYYRLYDLLTQFDMYH